MMETVGMAAVLRHMASSATPFGHWTNRCWLPISRVVMLPRLALQKTVTYLRALVRSVVAQG